MGIADLHKRAAKFAVDNSPTLLTAFGVAGTITTAVLASQASFKAAELIREEYQLRADEYDRSPTFEPGMTAKELFGLTWQLYIPAVTVGITTVGCIICANRIGTRRAAAMAAAYSISERAFEQYREKIVEKLGENKERAARDEIAQDQVTAKPVQDHQVIVTGGGESLCMDAYSGRYFYSDMETIKKAQNDLNYKLLHSFSASLNDFYNKIGLENLDQGEEVGWNSDQMLDIRFTTTMSDKQKPCIVINFTVSPVRNYFRVH